MSLIIGIAGGTASGKSTFAEILAEKLRESFTVKLVNMDAFYKSEDERPKNVSHLSGKTYMDDNVPDSIDFDAFHREIDSAAADVVIAEGLFALSDEYLKEKLFLRVYVDCRDDERAVRRLKRNMSWGLSFDEVAEVYLDMVRFRHDQLVEPIKWTADVIVNGASDTEKAAEMIKSYITERK